MHMAARAAHLSASRDLFPLLCSGQGKFMLARRPRLDAALCVTPAVTPIDAWRWQRSQEDAPCSRR
jgi:hypothetical protein